MKKTLLLFFALLTGVSGAWAEAKTFTVTYAKGNSYGTYYQSNGNADGGYYWDPKWVSGGNNCNQLPYVTITSDNNSLSGYNGYCLNGNYTISVPDGLVITGYTMQAKSYEEGITNSEKYITPAGQSAVALNTLNNTQVTVTGLTSNTATFSITGTEGQGSRVIFSSFTINVQGNIITSLASANSSKAYYVVSRRGFMSTVPGYAANTVKNTSYTPQPFKIVNESGSYYLKTLNGKYITSAGAQADAANGALASDDSNVADFPFVLKIGSNYLNSGTGGDYGIVWNTWGANTDQYDQGNCYAIMEAPADETLKYSLTDANGAVYSGTYNGVYGITTPEIYGCAGYTLTGASWDSGTRTYSATINFPFPVSSNSKTNYTYFANYNNENFIWFVTSDDATKVYVNKENHTSYNTTYTRFDWSVEPTFTSATSSFTFKIKNRATGTYLYSTSNDNSHQDKVTLNATGSALTFINNGGYRWVIPTGKQLSINSSGDNKGDQELGTWIQHGGTSILIVERTDFETLINNFTAAAVAFAPYDGKIGDGLGKYSGENAAAMQSAYSTAMSGSSEYTADDITANTTLLSNPASKLTLNIPSTPIFLRIRSSQGDKGYLTAAAAGGRATFTAATDASTIYLWASDKKLVAYGNGLAYAEVYQPQADGANGKEFSIVAAVSGNIGQYSIYSTYSGSQGNVYLYSTGSGNADRNTLYDSFKQQNSFTLEAVTTLPVTISSAKWATLYSPVALTIPNGVTVYYISGLTPTVATLSTISTTIPAETPVILYADVNDATTYNFDITTDVTAVSGNKLSGQVAAFSVSADDVDNKAYYTLQRNAADNTIVGFYPKTAAGSIAGFKAYLLATTLANAGVSNSRGLSFAFDDVDAINALGIGEQGDNVIYDLSGRRVNTPSKGIYIVNGRKVVVK